MAWLIDLCIWLIVLGVVFTIFMNYIVPAFPPPFQAAAKAIFALVCILILLGWIGTATPIGPWYHSGPFLTK